MKRSKRARAISNVIAEQPPLNATVLWKFPRKTFPDWLRLGMGEADTYDEYLERLRVGARLARRHGLTVIYCRKPPIEVAAWMIAEDLDPTSPEHRAQAIGVLAIGEMK